jgi:hypothetical protein
MKGRTEPPAFRFGRCYTQLYNGCWLWDGAVNNKGYPKFCLRNGVNVYAHRFAYEHAVGPIPPGLELDHLCNTPRCVNPEHLEPVTKAENLRRRRAQNSDTCAAGHAFTEANTYRPPSNPAKRMCRLCDRTRAARRTATTSATTAAADHAHQGDPR